MVNFRDRPAFETFINEQHWVLGKSLRAIERELGVGTTVVQSWCKRHRIKVRSRIEAATKSFAETKAAGKMSGENHWAYGKTKETHSLYAYHSKRMKEHNPSSLEGAIQRIIKHLRVYELKNIPLGEVILGVHFDALGIQYERQFIEGNSLRDFAIHAGKIIIELDGRGHLSRRDKDMLKDFSSVKRGWIVMRINFCNAKPNTDWHRLILVLKELVPGLEHVRTEPTSIRSQYRMLIRHADNPTGFRIYNPDEPTFIQFAHNRRNWLKTSLMG